MAISDRRQATACIKALQFAIAVEVRPTGCNTIRIRQLSKGVLDIGITAPYPIVLSKYVFPLTWTCDGNLGDIEWNTIQNGDATSDATSPAHTGETRRR
jgi:hypothetical protein